MNILRGLLGGSKTGRTEGAKENGGATKEEKGDLDVALIKKIGEGGNAVVWEGLWVGQRVAIKKYKNTEFGYTEAFAHELAIIKNLVHPMIIQYFGCSVKERLIVLELLVASHNLRELLNSGGLRKVEIAAGVAAALRYLHENRLLHNDIKAANVMITSLDPIKLKLIDFDCAVAIPEYPTSKADELTTAFQNIPRTVRWTPPELQDPKNRTVKLKHMTKCDVWSYGMFLWEVYTGKFPFDELGREYTVSIAIQNGQRPEIPEDCFAEYARLTEACWNADPDARPTFEEVVRVIEEMQASVDRHSGRTEESFGTEPSVGTGSSERSEGTESASLEGTWEEIDPSTIRLEEANLLGLGAFGTVYKTTWRGHQVAAKLIRIAAHHETSLREEVVHELRMLASMRSPYLVQFLAASSRNVPFLIITEFINGGSLRDLMKRTRTAGQVHQDLSLVRKLAKDMLKGLIYLHSRNVVHRDLKPDNILIQQKGDHVRAKIADFGLARVLGIEMTDTVGTFGYMAPEILTSQSYNEKADLFSFGMILFEMLFGTNPFIAKKAAGALELLSGKRPEFPADWQQRCPEGLQQLIMRCWEADPDARPSAEDALKIVKAAPKTSID